ncbi:MAG: 30S ribosomal protein S4 [Cytophagales bacterium]|nr:30S ribosomal protein S4 [Cytophagales bacterium]MDW8385253.1 30S ribosomal protein S4 [Flammeovirgaceae bacterium]
MARYIGPTSKISRRFREPIFGPAKELKKKNYPPGQHGKGKRTKQSGYAVQLNEKQKAKYTYGLLERQFRNLFEKASRKKGVTGTVLLQLLESRLDNTVYRLGMAPTRKSARQMVSHKHITVNGKVVNIPSYLLKPGDIISFKDKSKITDEIKASIAARQGRFTWLEWDNNLLQGKYLQAPERESIPEPIKEQLIVELYSK